MNPSHHSFISKDEPIDNTKGLFFRQFAALFWKNWIVLSRHKLPNLLRCVLLPVGYGVFLSFAQILINNPSNYGMGSPAPIYNFTTQFDGSLALIWADRTNGTGNPSASAIMAYITSGFNGRQRRAVKRVSSPANIPLNCPQNFNQLSHCYAGITFNHLPVSLNDTTPINYTISADGGLTYVNVYHHTSDFETRILPLQLAIDEAFIALRAGRSIPTPLEWPYTQETNQKQLTEIRLSYIRGISALLVIAHFVCYIGVAYQLPEAFARERASLLTSHMKAMGLLDSARIISWHVSMSLAYLPAWVIVAVIWHHKIFSVTNGSLILMVHLLLGFSLASWSFFVAAPFGKIPQGAAVAPPLLAILFAILALVFSRIGTKAATVFTLIFPPGYYVFAIRAICGYENHLMPTNLLKPDPDNNLTLLPIMIACVVNVFLWPYLGALLERRLYDAREPSGGFWTCLRSRKQDILPLHPCGAAISIKNLSKTFTPFMFSREKGRVTAISNLSLDIPKSGIFVLLGSNGAGKSILLSIIANLTERSSGSVTFEGGGRCLPRGMLGIVPQKNVLFPDLTCYQTLWVWHAIKYSSHSTGADKDYEQLLRDCDLGKKIHSNADSLSGGQKRKLQLAIGLLGGSKIILVDECTSGVDLLSRRAIWRTLTSVKHDRTIVFTTHFLDEADLLADHIAILTAPGKLVAEGSPVALKTNLGRGYSIHIMFDPKELHEKDIASSTLEILDRVREFAPQCALSQTTPIRAVYHLKSKDSGVVENVLQLLDDEAGNHHITSVDVLGTSIEDIFLSLMESESQDRTLNIIRKRSVDSTELASNLSISDPVQVIPASPPLALADGRPRSPFSQAKTIFYKRMLIAKRSWLTPVFAVLIAVCGACVPLFFLSGQAPSCKAKLDNETVVPLYLPILDSSSTPLPSILESPPNVTAALGPSAAFVLKESVSNNATFVSTIRQGYLENPIGGISIDIRTGNSLIAWEAVTGLTGPMLLNLATNILYNHALNASGHTAGTPSIILANYASFPMTENGENSTLAGLKWIAFFGAAMAVYPAFFSLYVSGERRSSVQAMQFSNGLSDPIGLWLGHLLWDSIFGIISATIIILVYAVASNQFYGLWLFWVILVQYGIVGILFSYCVSLFMSSPLTSFAAVAGYQIMIFVLYLASYLLILTYANISRASQMVTIIHFILSVLSPIASVARSAFISVNLFSLLCTGPMPVTTFYMMSLMQYGGPMLYLSIHSLVLFGILVWADSGSSILRRLFKRRKQIVQVDERFAANELPRQDVAREARAVARSSDALRVVHVTKSFDRKRVVDDVSFGVSEDVIFALLGPNGAGKSTTFNMIRGDVTPDMGDIKIKGISVVNSPRNARLALGVCPQFTAIDPQLTVREHLLIYGRLKGLAHGPELNDNVESLVAAISLNTYVDRLAGQLSGGNQRKLALAIALIGNPSVVLIDEFSSGVDAKMKRDMWGTLRKVAVGKAVVITTHSTEEASALANKVGIVSQRMLAIGTAEELAARYATYQVHFSCLSPRDVTRANVLMKHVPGARLVNDVATRFEVPIREHGTRPVCNDVRMSLAQLFRFLSSQGDFPEYTVEKATLENVFVKVIQQNAVLGEDNAPQRRRRFGFWRTANHWDGSANGFFSGLRKHMNSSKKYDDGVVCDNVIRMEQHVVIDDGLQPERGVWRSDGYGA